MALTRLLVSYTELYLTNDSSNSNLSLRCAGNCVSPDATADSILKP